MAGWALVGVPDYVHDLESTGVATLCNAIQEGGGVGINLLGVAFSWGNGEFLLLKKTSDPNIQHQPLYLSLAVLLGEWWVGEGNLFMWSKSEWPSLETRHSWVLKLNKNYKTNLMTPVLFWGTFLLCLCLCWVIPIFLCCVWPNSLNSLHELNTLLNPTARDSYLNTNNLDAHHFHLSHDAFGDLWETFFLSLMFHSLPSEGARMILSGFSFCHSSSERTGKFSIKSHLRIFCLP